MWLYTLIPRVERLWRDVWSAVTCNYEDLHALEEEGLLDLSDEIHLFCVHYTILPRLRSDLKCFLNGWNEHPLRTEGNLSPDQLWHIGMLQTSVPDVEVKHLLFTLLCLHKPAHVAKSHQKHMIVSLTISWFPWNVAIRAGLCSPEGNRIILGV